MNILRHRDYIPLSLTLVCNDEAVDAIVVHAGLEAMTSGGRAERIGPTVGSGDGGASKVHGAVCIYDRTCVSG